MPLLRCPRCRTKCTQADLAGPTASYERMRHKIYTDKETGEEREVWYREGVGTRKIPAHAVCQACYKEI